MRPRPSLLAISYLGNQVQLRRCGVDLFKRLALTLKTHWQDVLNAFESCLFNDAVEGKNAQTQVAKACSRRFRRVRSLITVSYLVCGKLIHLPAAPYGRTCRLAAA